ncbi:hypothetical protein SALB1_2653 [Salinisphaera sp. LB1]|nr:hypothetical protein SALB1_2653 [Salinisphaera sp. LB1]
MFMPRRFRATSGRFEAVTKIAAPNYVKLWQLMKVIRRTLEISETQLNTSMRG